MLKISVVTACYNAEAYVEQTMRSVLDQDYPNLEYIVLDGASTDATPGILERYKPRLAYCASEPDGGQYEAIQRGLEKATGDVMCWVNADDMLMPWTLSVVGEIFKAFPEVDWITGLPSFMNKRGQVTSVYGALGAYPQDFIAQGWYNRYLGGFLQQESLFWRRSLWEKAGGLDLSLRYAADYELWIRFARHSPLIPVSVPLAAFRKLPGEQRSSTGAETYDAEVAQVMAGLKSPPGLWSCLSRRGLVVRSLTRLMIRRRTPAILYDEAAGEWRKIVTRRPIARLRLGDLMQLHALQAASTVRGGS